MSDRTQDIKNLRAVATACKNYTDKKIEDLRWELGTYDLGVESDNTSALVKTMPSGTIKANVNKIYGASEVMVNDFDSNLTSISDDTGVTHSKVGNSYVIVNSSSSSSRIVLNTNLNGKHTFVFDSDTAIPYGFRINSLSLQNNIVVGKNIFEDIAFTGNNPISIYVPANSTVTISNIVSTTNYFTNIHNLELSGLKVEGANKAQTPSWTGGYHTTTGGYWGNYSTGIRNQTKIYLQPSTQYTISYKMNLGNSTLTRNLVFVCQYTNDGTFIERTSATIVQASVNGLDVATFTTSADVGYVEFSNYIESVSGDYTALFDGAITEFMVNIGSTALPYEAYVSITKNIDLTTIVDSNNNKLFPNGKLMGNTNVKDVLGVYSQQSKWIEYTFTGNETWTKSGVETNNSYYCNVDSLVFANTTATSTNVTWDNTIPNLVHTKYSATSGNLLLNTDLANVITLVNRTNGLQIRFGAGLNNDLTPEQVVQLFANTTLQYERATPLTSNTDLSATLRNIQGYSNGSITAQNTYDMATTSEIDYLVEEVKA